MNAAQRKWVSLAGLALAVLVAYSPVWHAGFIWDDDAHVTTNPVIVGPQGLKEIWTSAKANYFPLTMTSFWVQHALWGLDPRPYHLVNVGQQAICAVLMFLVLARLRVPGAALGAALWALHPVQVESVAWISELKNTQSCLFFLLSVWFFLRWVRPETASPRRRDYLWALVGAALAMLSKASTVMLPVVLGLVWWWVGGWRWRNAIRLLPFLALSLAASGWTIWEQKVNSMASGADWHHSLLERLTLSGQVVWFYLGKLAWPHPLIFIYPRWELEAARATAWLPLLALLVAAVGLTWWREGRARPWFFAGAYFAVSLFPVMGFFDVFYFRYSFVADHFQHLASMGPLALAGAGLAQARSGLLEARPGVRAGLAAVPVLVLAALTWRQCAIYRDSHSLWSDTVARNPRAWIGRVNLGVELVARGQYEAALEHYRTALRLRPGAAEIQTNFGAALLHLGRHGEAVPVLEAATRSVPNLHAAWNLLGLALAGTGRPVEAERAFATAVRLKPDFAPARFNYGNLLAEQQRTDEAVAQLEAALTAGADPAVRKLARRRLADLLVAAGRGGESIGHLEALLAQDPAD
ncbi:MAG: tetratricopeptide repeat protein, partial [Verrucomicrobia bacterium]|nr:tetratricopeptide repeat protein [Verrucomicrobiota bacterium]